jgi:hypothetical protein
MGAFVQPKKHTDNGLLLEGKEAQKLSARAFKCNLSNQQIKSTAVPETKTCTGLVKTLLGQLSNEICS